MKIIYSISHILFILAINASPTCQAYTKALFMGTVQFPKGLASVDPIRVYCQGNIIPTETNNTTLTVTFALPFEEKRKTYFNLVITEKIECEYDEGNTIKYLKIAPEQSYKFYTLQLIKEEHHKDNDFTFASSKEEKKNNNDQLTYRWHIDEQEITRGGHIPDDAIIVYYKPEYVESLEGGNAVELPHIIIKNNILKIVGSEAKLHEKSTALLLSSLDLDAIHAPVHHEVKQELQRSRVTMITT